MVFGCLLSIIPLYKGKLCEIREFVHLTRCCILRTQRGLEQFRHSLNICWLNVILLHYTSFLLKCLFPIIMDVVYIRFLALIRYRKILSFRKSYKTIVTHKNQILICCVNLRREGKRNMCLWSSMSFITYIYIWTYFKLPLAYMVSCRFEVQIDWISIWMSHLPTECCLNYRLGDNNTYLYFFSRVY